MKFQDVYDKIMNENKANGAMLEHGKERKPGDMLVDRITGKLIPYTKGKHNKFQGTVVANKDDEYQTLRNGEPLEHGEDRENGDMLVDPWTGKLIPYAKGKHNKFQGTVERNDKNFQTIRK